MLKERGKTKGYGATFSNGRFKRKPSRFWKRVIADGADHMRQVYTAAMEDCSGRVTVPEFYDKQNVTSVSNELADTILMFNSAFGRAGALAGNYYSEGTRVYALLA